MKNELLNDAPRGFYPFWFWNGEMTKEEVRWQIQEMAGQGVKGFFLHLRQGMTVPYLSEAFFELIRHAVDTATELGMHAQLYDEYPYPSGAAGGEAVLGRPDLYATRLVHEAFEIDGPVRRAMKKGHLLSCMAFPIEGERVAWDKGVDLRGHVGVVITDQNYVEIGLTTYNRKRFLANEPTPTLEVSHLKGRHRVVASFQMVVDDHKYFTHFIDPLNPEGVKRFLEVTHERYAKQLGARLGRDVRTIFTDETTAGWSPRLPGAFKERYGYDLIAAMPALAEPGHPEADRVRMDLQALKTDMFSATFDEPVQRWCREHGILYVAEKPTLRMSMHRFVDVPGCEPGHTKAGQYPDILGIPIRGNCRATASAGYFYKKQATACECYHSMGWSATLQDVRLLADAQILLGIDWLAPHGFFYSTHGLTKHDAPPSFFFQMPYWKFWGHLSKRVDRLAELYLAGTAPTARVLLVEPHAGTDKRDELQAYELLMRRLMAMQVEFLHVDVDILEEGTIKDGRVKIQDVECGVVVVPQMMRMEPALAAWLKKFEGAGGAVVHAGSPLNEAALAKIPGLAGQGLKVSAAQGSREGVWLGTRKGGGRTVHMLINVGREPVTLNLECAGGLKELPLDDGAVAMLGGVDGGWRRKLDAYECVLLEEGSGCTEAEPVVAVAKIEKAVSFATENKNLLRMYTWKMSLAGQPGSGLVGSVPIANQLAQAKMAFEPKWSMAFGVMPKMTLPVLEARYEAEFDCAFAGDVELVMEPGGIVGEWSIQVNDSPELKAGDFKATQTLVRGCLGVPVTGMLKHGRNRVTVKVKTQRLDGGLLNALYLAGDFGVTLGSAGSAATLTARKTQGAFEAWEANGLPYYAGALTYEGTFSLTGDVVAQQPKALALAWPEAFEDAAQVSLNGGPWKTVLWSPSRVAVKASDLKTGVNTIRIRVHTALLRAFEGQRFDIGEHVTVGVGDL